MLRKPTVLAAAAVLSFGCGGGLVSLAQAPDGGVFVLSIADAIGPSTSNYVTEGIDQAIAADAALIVIEMDTPGGLDTSMREIIQAILQSPVPVASFVYPQGARAASAGTYILYASHVAAMAPATNLGAATPVAIGGASPISLPDGGAADDAEDSDSPERFLEPRTTSERKAINDAVAYIRSLAERRGRNADWAERAVWSSASLSADAALAEGVIDLVARDLDDLLRQLNGRTINGNRLALPPTTLVTLIEPDWRTRFLAVITNPTVAYMLMLIGIYGLVMEGYNPGAVVPGVVGAISLLLALYAFQVLPVNFAGLALIVLGLVLMLAEFFVPSFGALGIGGVAAFVFGSVILVDTHVPGFEVATGMIAGIAFSGALLLIGTVWLAMRARGRQVVSGVEEMSGMTAEALEDFVGEGQVWVHGERWQACAKTPISKGQRLTVRRVEGLVLQVEPAVSQPQ
jgi:membrane-bound serine protease (ClpP class)